MRALAVKHALGRRSAVESERVALVAWDRERVDRTVGVSFLVANISKCLCNGDNETVRKGTRGCNNASQMKRLPVFLFAVSCFVGNCPWYVRAKYLCSPKVDESGKKESSIPCRCPYLHSMNDRMDKDMNDTFHDLLVFVLYKTELHHPSHQAPKVLPLHPPSRRAGARQVIPH